MEPVKFNDQQKRIIAYLQQFSKAILFETAYHIISQLPSESYEDYYHKIFHTLFNYGDHWTKVRIIRFLMDRLDSVCWFKVLDVLRWVNLSKPYSNERNHAMGIRDTDLSIGKRAEFLKTFSKNALHAFVYHFLYQSFIIVDYEGYDFRRFRCYLSEQYGYDCNWTKEEIIPFLLQRLDEDYNPNYQWGWYALLRSRSPEEKSEFLERFSKDVLIHELERFCDRTDLEIPPLNRQGSKSEIIAEFLRQFDNYYWNELQKFMSKQISCLDDSPVDPLRAGIECYETGRYQEAIRHLTEVTKKQESFHEQKREAWAYLGFVYGYGLKNYQQAVSCLEMAHSLLDWGKARKTKGGNRVLIESISPSPQMALDRFKRRLKATLRGKAKKEIPDLELKTKPKVKPKKEFHDSDLFYT